ncbi:tripartite tricarboxylate transporter TctB family protein [uncultured Sphaerochaeta sp.]|uniref:tripartite tricarboxylate transporter TctB family protein n=1 Tax=uncultured Sphaerochaeta sp. TaxID=886478 RepID=UPI002A0A138C|nr:tripartite tricarboxylate transporter TctB family protein [uncultured Sphaerochaeta sp.]
MSQIKKTTASDLIMGVLLLAFGIYLIVESLGMKVFNSFLDAPGFFPFILGIIFCLFGIVMVIGSLRGGSVAATKATFRKDSLIALFLNPESKRVVILSFFMVVYIYGLIGRIHFAIATFLYLVVTFWYLKSTTWLKNIIISVLSALLISAIFQYVFKIPLP